MPNKRNELPNFEALAAHGINLCKFIKKNKTPLLPNDNLAKKIVQPPFKGENLLSRLSCPKSFLL
ncbi:hypothetical protein [Hugenholtzia roseola]|uniref:hypothetical protein n=1 Tax=Hugenholtzia roseola TaxID=1002 RepID=UPI0004293D34|nr:hypothetical protein [Hugenholtzia roseola]